MKISNTDRLLNALEESAAGRAAPKSPEQKAIGTVENVDAVRLSSDLNVKNDGDRQAKIDQIRADIARDGIQKGYFEKRGITSSEVAGAVERELFSS